MIYDLWVIVNWLLAFAGTAYAVKNDDMPMAIGWFICLTGWLGLVR